MKEINYIYFGKLRGKLGRLNLGSSVLRLGTLLMMIIGLSQLNLAQGNSNDRNTTKSSGVVNEENVKQANDYIRKMMEKQGIVGVSYAVLLDGKLIYKNAMGYANNEHKVPMSTSSVFAVASISKLFSSTALHRLLNLKKRSVDETVGEFLSKHKNLPVSWKTITLKQLLSHTSGIPDQINYDIFLAPESDEFVIKELRNKPFQFTPGERNRYNATGFMLVRMIIEELAGQDFESHIKENFFKKFNMKTARYGGFKMTIPNRVKSYRMAGKNFEMFPLNYSPTMYAAAGLNVNVEELTYWMEAILAGRVLSKEHLNTVWAPVKRNDETEGSYGLGWHYLSEGNARFPGHGGAGISSVRHYWKKDSPENLTVIFLTNGAKDWTKMPDDINREIAEIFLPTLFK